MIRLISILGMTSGFLLISPPFRGSVLSGLASAIAVLAQYSPYSYLGLALLAGTGAVRSLASPKPR
jgi:hypothetical protein